MAIFKITPAESVFTDSDNAFEFDSLGADTLIVDPGAFLITTFDFAAGAFLFNTGAWTVAVNGSIFSQRGVGIHLGPNNAAVSSITIGANGEVGGSAEIAVDSSATIKNAGVITGTSYGILMANAGTNTIKNSGIISGEFFSILDGFSLNSDKVTNSGTLNGDVGLGNGDDTLTNVQKIGKKYIAGTIFGDVFLNDGDDVVTNFAKVGKKTVDGTISGTIDLGDGNDIFNGGKKAEIVSDGDGADIVKLGAGNDFYIATGSTGNDGGDTISGGKGIDIYYANAAGNPVEINLDTIAHDQSPFDPGIGVVAANRATGIDVAGAFTDNITGFEKATGGTGSDVIYGSAAANTLDGSLGDDILAGFGGSDTLIGGGGGDRLFGGAGKDILTGGPDGDRFQFASIKDSGVTKATRDVITDFKFGFDIINLSLIDANRVNGPGDDAFNFIGTNVAFGGNAGELRAYWTATGQIIEGDVNGDAKADFSIEIVDPTHAITLSAVDGADFFL